MARYSVGLGMWFIACKDLIIHKSMLEIFNMFDYIDMICRLQIIGAYSNKNNNNTNNNDDNNNNDNHNNNNKTQQ